MLKQILFIFLLVIFNFSIQCIGYCQSSYSHPSTDDEFVGPFSSWIDVKTKFGAAGNGVTDDTQALQRAFDAIGSYTNTASVVYLPAGTYRITSKLILKSKRRIGIIGADPSTTKIVWAGAQDGTMLLINGVEHSHFNRITWDGRSIAKIAVDQSWDGIANWFDSGNEFADDVFLDVGFGIHGGFSYEVSFAETGIMRCKFIRNTIAGIALGNFNALDIWIWNSIFEDCAIGVTNDVENGAGGFKVYHSIFRRSTIADIKIGNTVEFSFRDNTSTNSKAFIIAGWTPNPASITIQGNTIIDSIDPVTIKISNQGQITMLDNIIRSRAGINGPVVVVDGAPNSDLLAIGNTFTVTNSIQSDRNIIYSSSVVSRGSLTDLIEPVLPGTEPNLNRPILEVPPGANAEVIQGIINKAVDLSGKRPVVHIPYGIYPINATIIIPAGSDLQLVGDSYWSIFQWKGDNSCNTILKIEGPTKVTVRDLLLEGEKLANGILVTKADQVGSRIFSNKSESHNNNVNYAVNGLDNTLVLLTNAGYTQAIEKAITVIGGPLAAANHPVQGRTVIYAGYAFNNTVTCEISNKGNLLIRDAWYESRYVNQFLNLVNSGIFTIEGSHIQNHAPSKISSFSGNVTLLNSYISDKILTSGNATNIKLLGIGMHSENDSYLANVTPTNTNIRTINTRSRQFNVPGSGSYPVANIGVIDQDFITEMLKPIRNTHAQILAPLPSGVTDLRFYRVFTEQCITGFEFRGAGAQIEWAGQ
ncbi:MAG: hypothetical protein EOP34_04835 [Rickettsiales bacterium]|nr:MAG: hypothetical protein EOP34_04835 [Rickettsiales bacterium]